MAHTGSSLAGVGAGVAEPERARGDYARTKAAAELLALAADGPDLARAVRAAAGVPVAAVLTVPELPTDIRHNSKVDRARLSRWATSVLSGGRMVRP